MNTAALNEAKASIRARTAFVPEVGIVLGSGLGDLVHSVRTEFAIPYREIKGFPVPSVSGHGGQLVLGLIGDTRVALLQGRVHLYEGHSPDAVACAVRALALLGMKTLVLTNAAGGINHAFGPGDLMIIKDHINLQGTNPLLGPNDSSFGPRFPDMSEVYDHALQAHITECACNENIKVRTGVYAGVLGPVYETPAEVRMLERFGADAVGMSTVCEAIAARHMGVRICGISLITNVAAGLAPGTLTHEDVQATAARAMGDFVRLMVHVLRTMPKT